MESIIYDPSIQYVIQYVIQDFIKRTLLSCVLILPHVIYRRSTLFLPGKEGHSKGRRALLRENITSNTKSSQYTLSLFNKRVYIPIPEELSENVGFVYITKKLGFYNKKLFKNVVLIQKQLIWMYH